MGYSRCFSVSQKSLLRFQLLHFVFVNTSFNQVVNVLEGDLRWNRYFGILLSNAIAMFASEDGLMTGLDWLDVR